MELKQFVESTINDLVSAGTALQETLGREVHLVTTGANQSGRVNFDVAVTVEDGTQGGGGIKVALLNLGGSVSSSTSTVTRLQFSYYVSEQTKEQEEKSRSSLNKAFSPRH